jgi:hypothetical protein
MDAALKRSAEHMVRTMWRRNIPALVERLCKEEGIGFTQASAVIAQAMQSFVDAAQEPWQREQAKKVCQTCGGMDAFMNQAYLEPCPTCSTEKMPKAPKKRAIIGIEDPELAAYHDAMRPWTVTVAESNGYRPYLKP